MVDGGIGGGEVDLFFGCCLVSVLPWLGSGGSLFPNCLMSIPHLPTGWAFPFSCFRKARGCVEFSKAMISGRGEESWLMANTWLEDPSVCRRRHVVDWRSLQYKIIKLLDGSLLA